MKNTRIDENEEPEARRILAALVGAVDAALYSDERTCNVEQEHTSGHALAQRRSGMAHVLDAVDGTRCRMVQEVFGGAREADRRLCATPLAELGLERSAGSGESDVDSSEADKERKTVTDGSSGDESSRKFEEEWSRLQEASREVAEQAQQLEHERNEVAQLVGPFTGRLFPDRFPLTCLKKAALEKEQRKFEDNKAALEEKELKVANEIAAVAKLQRSVENDKAVVEKELVEVAKERTAIEKLQLRVKRDKAAVEKELFEVANERAAIEKLQLKVESDKAAAEKEQLEVANERAAIEEMQRSIENDKAAIERKQLEVFKERVAIEEQRSSVKHLEGDIRETKAILDRWRKKNLQAAREYYRTVRATRQFDTEIEDKQERIKKLNHTVKYYQNVSTLFLV